MTTAAPDERPFVAPCCKLAAGAPLGWLKLGWQDFRRAPGQSLAYGLVIAALSWVVTAIGLKMGSYWAVLVLLSGFVFVAPVLALGLYSISRQLGAGMKPSLGRCFGEQRRGLGTAMVFALALLVVFLVWARAGSMLHVFFPVEAHPDSFGYRFGKMMSRHKLAFGAGAAAVVLSLCFAATMALGLVGV